MHTRQYAFIGDSAKFAVVNRILFLLLLATALPASAELTLFAASDLLTDGAVQSDEHPILGATADIELGSGVFADATVFTSTSTPGPGRTRGATVSLGWFGELGRHQAMQVRLKEHRFTGDFPRDWDYRSLESTWFVSRRSALTLRYSPDFHGRGEPAVSLMAGTQQPLGDRYYLHGLGGVTRVDGRSPLAFITAGAGLTVGRWDIRLSAHLGDRDSQALFQSDHRGGITLRVSMTAF